MQISSFISLSPWRSFQVAFIGYFTTICQTLIFNFIMNSTGWKTGFYSRYKSLSRRASRPDFPSCLYINWVRGVESFRWGGGGVVLEKLFSTPFDAEFTNLWRFDPTSPFFFITWRVRTGKEIDIFTYFTVFLYCGFSCPVNKKYLYSDMNNSSSDSQSLISTKFRILSTASTLLVLERRSSKSDVVKE